MERNFPGMRGVGWGLCAHVCVCMSPCNKAAFLVVVYCRSRDRAVSSLSGVSGMHALCQRVTVQGPVRETVSLQIHLVTASSRKPSVLPPPPFLPPFLLCSHPFGRNAVVFSHRVSLAAVDAMLCGPEWLQTQ